VRLTQREDDRLTLFLAAELARARQARGLLLNAPEATAIIADAVSEAARDGARLAVALERGRTVLRPDDVLPGVPDLVRQVQVEALFDDGSRLVIIDAPLGAGSGPDGPGAVLALDEPIRFRRDDVVSLTVRNTAAVPVGVTSHFHFFEANPRLHFDRAAAYGRRLAIGAGESVRIAPGEERVLELVPIRGDRVAIGFAGLVDGPLDAPGAREAALDRARACGYLGA
jgi:urease subunit gamma/beta